MFTNKEIAETIVRQLGGNRFVVMTGAKNLRAIDRGVALQLPARFAKDGITYVQVVLDPSDTYTMTFKKIGPLPSLKRLIAGAEQKITVVASVSDVYNDMLQTIFTKYTGLDCHL